MPKGTRKKPYVQTGQTNFGKLGMSSESDVVNSRGKVVSGNPRGGAARAMIGDKGIKSHKKAVEKDAKKLAKSKEGAWRKTVTTSSKSKQAGPKRVAKTKTTKKSKK